MQSSEYIRRLPCPSIRHSVFVVKLWEVRGATFDPGFGVLSLATVAYHTPLGSWPGQLQTLLRTRLRSFIQGTVRDVFVDCYHKRRMGGIMVPFTDTCTPNSVQSHLFSFVVFTSWFSHRIEPAAGKNPTSTTVLNRPLTHQ